MRRVLTRGMFGFGVFLLGITGGACAGWVRGELWLEAHPEHDQSEDVLVFMDAAVGGCLGFIIGSAAATVIESGKDRQVRPTTRPRTDSDPNRGEEISTALDRVVRSTGLPAISPAIPTHEVADH